MFNSSVWRFEFTAVWSDDESFLSQPQAALARLMYEKSSKALKVPCSKLAKKGRIRHKLRNKASNNGSKSLRNFFPSFASLQSLKTLVSMPLRLVGRPADLEQTIFKVCQSLTQPSLGKRLQDNALTRSDVMKWEVIFPSATKCKDEDGTIRRDISWYGMIVKASDRLSWQQKSSGNEQMHNRLSPTCFDTSSLILLAQLRQRYSAITLRSASPLRWCLTRQL